MRTHNPAQGQTLPLPATGTAAAEHTDLIKNPQKPWSARRLSGRATALGGLFTRLASKLTAYTVGQVLNAGLGRPLRRLADLLV